MLLHRDHRWLLEVRGADVDDAAGQLGLVGGHVEHGASGRDVLEATARREAYEEVGLDLTGVGLTYLESEAYTTDTGVGQVTAAFVASAPAGVDPYVAATSEVTAVGWWTVDEVRADPRCPPWLPGLLERAAKLVTRGTGDYAGDPHHPTRPPSAPPPNHRTDPGNSSLTAVDLPR